ncbi:DUF4192 family protein [Microbacterium sp. 10M-3C3]|jgi:hypothetical protein|uniref:DUF4192 family protein n=1 Tax=Microbacterium sp. 10M-3C3 TaxID=2483401 RepID=UPI000F63A1AC|nr:DUF4192 family protein [Microbacterium sp. 10M-3C3]
MTTVIRAAGAADFLALVPHLIGYRPVRSLVLIPFEDSRTLGALRLDLPPDDLPPLERESMSATAIGMVCKVRHADAVALVVYTDDPVAAGAAVPASALVAEVLQRADMCGLRITDALCVGHDAWVAYAEPARIHAAAEIRAADAATTGLPPVGGDQASGAELPPADLAAKERVARALDEIGHAMTALFGDETDTARPNGETAGGGERERIRPQALATVCRLDDVPLLFEDALAEAADRLDPYDAAALVWCLDRPGLRDVALMQWFADLAAGDAAFDAQMRWSDGAPYPEELAAPMWGEGPQPDPVRLLGALALTRRLAAVAPRALRPGALSACAWLAWAVGRSTHAAQYAAWALEIDPAHGLAAIVHAMVDAAHLPEWVYERSAT